MQRQVLDDFILHLDVIHTIREILTRIYYVGDYEREHVIIRVCHDCYLVDYALVQIVRNDEDLPNVTKECLCIMNICYA